jgi:hypothetical protein
MMIPSPVAAIENINDAFDENIKVYMQVQDNAYKVDTSLTMYFRNGCVVKQAFTEEFWRVTSISAGVKLATLAIWSLHILSHCIQVIKLAYSCSQVSIRLYVCQSGATCNGLVIVKDSSD